jgi:hypothetical protein
MNELRFIKKWYFWAFTGVKILLDLGKDYNECGFGCMLAGAFGNIVSICVITYIIFLVFDFLKRKRKEKKQ